MIKSVWKCVNIIEISHKRCMEQAEIIDTFWTYQMPMLDVHDNFPIPNDVHLALMKLVQGHPFDFENYFIHTMVSCADDHNSHKPYAPWLMAICNYSQDVPFPVSIYPKIFTPTVRKVLQIVTRPNDQYAEHTGIRAHM